MHRLPVPESQIVLIDNELAFCNFLEDLKVGVSVVGVDSEWKPSFGVKKCDLALIQVATLDVIYILDVLELSRRAPKSIWGQFASSLFANPDILKLGFGLGGDLAIMKETLPGFQGLKMAGLGFMDLVALWRVLVNKYNYIFPFPPKTDGVSTSESLSRLVELCFDETLDKSDQFSNWERRPLRKSQMTYAGT